jgi:hypothetical protein
MEVIHSLFNLVCRIIHKHKHASQFTKNTINVYRTKDKTALQKCCICLEQRRNSEGCKMLFIT